MAATDDPDLWLASSAANLAEMFAGTALRGGQRTARWDDAWAVDRQLPDPLLNFATVLRPLTAETFIDLTARLDAFFGEAEGEAWSLWSAWPTPDLAPLGYAPFGRPPLMVRLPGSDPVSVPEELQIVEVLDADQLAAFERTVIDGYPVSTLEQAPSGTIFRPQALGGSARFWLGYAHGRLVTVAASCQKAGVVGIQIVATLPDARGRGYGAAITDAAARTDPLLPALLTSSDLGRPVYERLGFRTVSRYTLWLRSGRR